jgi:cytochrome c oxidase accessory protein FixG
MANVRRLPVISEGSLGRDGRHKRPYPADVSGRFVRARWAVYLVLIAIWAALPWIPVGGHPAVFLDVDKRQFFLFGATFNAQDMWLLFFALSGVGFGLVYATMLLGRVWCGWACPQTVFLEALFRPIERLINGPRNIAQRRARAPLGIDRIWRILATHGAYVMAALLVAHIFLAYFVSMPRVFEMVRANPAAHPEAFGWMLAVTGVMYGNFAFFREQLCVVVCPYGRLQSVLIDDDSLVVGYDEKRGEPRGKAVATDEPRGDCVDCNRCVVVCPTAIDIRDGLQLDCIACTACIDACDDVMDKLERPRGLIRYDSLRGLRGTPGEKRRILRPRLYAYTALLVLGAVVATFAFRKREPFEANIVRLAGTPYTRENGTIRNAFELHVVNKGGSAATFEVEPAGDAELAFVIPIARFELAPLASRRIPVFVTMDQARFTTDRPFTVRIHGHVDARDASSSVEHEARAVFLGAKR